MINNRQVNFWRGDKEPPTIYHIWIKDNSKMLLHNGTEWVVFLDNGDLVSQVNELLNATINNKLIKDSPILYGTDITLGSNSNNFFNKDDTISKSIERLDTLLTTQII